MSSKDELIRWLTRTAMFGDFAVLGAVSVYATSRLVAQYLSDSSALKRIKLAPEVRVSDLKDMVLLDGEDWNDMVAVVKGTVEAMTNLDGGKVSVPAVLISQQTGEVGVVLERTQKCTYNTSKGISGWLWSLRYLFSTSLIEPKINTRRKVPFALVNSEPESKNAFILVNLDDSSQQLPVDTIYHQIHALRPTPLSFIQALFGHEYPIAVIEEEKMLLLGKEVYAAGICSSKDGVLRIRASEDFPYFLSDMNKGQMIADLTSKNRKLFWGTLVLASVSVGILGYSVYRNWSKWIHWRRSRRTLPDNNTTNDTNAEQRRIVQRTQYPDDADAFDETSEASVEAYIETVDDYEEDNHDIPQEQSCIVCLVRNRHYAFFPCGHQVCCYRCATNVQNETPSQCPVCRQATLGFLRIYQS